MNESSETNGMSLRTSFSESVSTDECAHHQRLATLGTLSAALAHEINNLLVPIVGYAELALETPEDQAMMIKSLTRTLAAARQGVQVCDSVLGLSRNADDGANAPTQTCVGDALDATVEVLRWSESAAGMTVRRVLTPDSVTVAIAPGALQQILLNLLLNARKAMGRGGVVTLEAGPGDEAGRVQIVVRDNGPGIDPSQTADLFAPFVTHPVKEADAGAHRSGERGSGLGLWICRELLEAAGGTIRLESPDSDRPGAGFVLSLPGVSTSEPRQRWAA